MRTAVLLSLGLAASLPAQDPAPLGERLERAFLDGTGPKFFGSCLVARNGKVLLRRGFGEKKAETTIDTDTLFDVASIGKQFTAAAVLLLEGEGRLSTFDRLDTFFRRIPEDKAGITLHQLLTHTSGLPLNIELDESERNDRKRMLQRVWSVPLQHGSGQAYEYSNLGYHILGAVIEKVSNRTFGAFLYRRLFKPAGMQHTGFPGDERLADAHAAPRWEGHRDPRYKDTATDWAWHWGFRGAAGIVTSAEDLYRWDRVLHDDAILNDAVRSKFFSPGADGYALGWEATRTSRHSLRLSHTGRCYGFQSLYIRFPDEDACIIAVGNLDMKPAVIDTNLSKVLFAEPPPMDLLRASVGRFRLPKQRGTFELAVRGDQLVLRPFGVEPTSRVLHAEKVARTDDYNRPSFDGHARDLLKPLVRGYAKKLAENFARTSDPATIRACGEAWKDCVSRHGRCRSVRVIGTDPTTGTSWIDVQFGSETLRWNATWVRGPKIATLTRDTSASHPFERQLNWRRDRVYWVRSTDGFGDIELEIVDVRGKPELRWRDRSTGSEFLRCPRK